MITFQRHGEPALHRERMAYAASMMAAFANKLDAPVNLEVTRWLEDAGIAHRELQDMLKAILNGEKYRDLVQASAVRVGMYEIQFGLRIERNDDPEHFAFSYLVIPLSDSYGRMVLRDSLRVREKVIIVWEAGKIRKITQ
jgi:hypothetical protein